MMVTEKPVPASACGQFVKTTFELGKGTQRIVHRGNDLRTGRCVAWCEPKFKGEKEWESFTRTSSLLENVHHKNIVSFLDFWEASPTSSRTPVLITELLGCTLKQHLHTSPRCFESSSIKSWAHQILEAIAYLHLHSHMHHVIIHRTIRCDHVCINANTGDIKLSSFGSAILKERGKYLEEMVGSVEFMSPEMVNEHYNESTDVYSYGICLLEMATLEYPYEECDKISQTVSNLKSERYPKALESVQCVYTRDLIRMCLEHDVEKRLTIDMIMNHPFFQSPLPTGSPKIAYHSFDGDMVTVSVVYAEGPEVPQLYSFNLLTDNSRYVAASLVRGEYIKESQLQEASIQLHKIIEKVKRQSRIKSEMMDYYPIAQPIGNSKSPAKTTKGVALTLCSFDADEHHVELELSQTRIGKIVKFQFGIMDNEVEEIAGRLVTEGHLIADNKAEFIAQLNGIVKEQRELARAQEHDSEENGKEDFPSSENATSEFQPNSSDLSIEVRRKVSRDNSQPNNATMSPDIDTRSIISDHSASITMDGFPVSKSMANGMDSSGTVISPPIQTSRGVTVPSYYRPPTSMSQQPGVLFYPPQYMMVPGGITSPAMAGHQMSVPGHQLPSNYVMMPAGAMTPGPMAPGPMPNSMYTNGHMPGQGWTPHHGTPMPGSVRSTHDMNNIRMPVSAAHIPYMADQHRTELEIRSQYGRSDQDTPPPGYAGEPSAVDT